jgi:hypothetical protein
MIIEPLEASAAQIQTGWQVSQVGSVGLGSGHGWDQWESLEMTRMDDVVDVAGEQKQSARQQLELSTSEALEVAAAAGQWEEWGHAG